MEVKIVNVEPIPSIAIRDNCSFAQLGDKIEEIYDEIYGHLKQNKIEFGSGPFSVYHSFSPESIDLEAGVPVKGSVEKHGRMYPMQTYSGKAAMTVYTGHYDGLNKYWSEFAKAVDAENHELNGPCFEVYTIGPDTEPDNSKWITHLYTPIK